MKSLSKISAERILKLIKALEKNLKNIDEDVENIHQVRVASRRIRSTLPVLKEEMEKNRYRKLLNGIKGITNAFGEVRDLDVQILYLENLVKKMPDMRIVLEDRRSKRADLDKYIKETSSSIANISLLNDLKKECKHLISVNKELCDSDFFKIYREILSRLKIIQDLEDTLSDPKNQTGHHALRIAIKKLRYSLENYGLLFSGNLDYFISEVKSLQTYLGNIHDFDVWYGVAIKILNGEEKLNIKKNLDKGEFFKTLEKFISDISEKRQLEFKSLVKKWGELKEENFFENILLRISKKLPLPDYFNVNNNIRNFGGSDIKKDDVFLSAKLESYGINEIHSKNVCEISLSLFDRLKNLHKLGETERWYLKFSAMLHDIGWSEGMKSHNKNSMKLIMQDDELNLNVYEKLIVGNIARYHRKQIKEKHWNYKILDEASKQTVKKLSALLRIADALDLEGEFTYNKFVLEAHGDEVMLIFPEKPIESVLKRINKKKDIFEETYCKKLTQNYKNSRQ